MVKNKIPKFSSISPLLMLLWSFILHVINPQNTVPIFFIILEESMKGLDNLNVNVLGTRTLKSMKD